MKNLLYIILFFSTSFTTVGQGLHKIQSLSSLIEVNGTSTLHDWTSTLKKMSGSANFLIEGTDLNNLTGLNFKANAENLKSGRGSMDDNTYEALMTNKFPFFMFSQTGASTVRKTGNSYKVMVPGKLSISKGARTINLEATCIYKQQDWLCSGTHKIKMTDYGVQPPTAVMGTIKTGDELIIDYKILFVK